MKNHNACHSGNRIIWHHTLVRDNKVILKDITWKVRDRDHWAVLGANGSGKTTLLRIVAGYVWPSEGKVSIFGRNFGSIDLR